MIGQWTEDDELYRQIWHRLFEERLEGTDDVTTAEDYADEYAPREYAQRAYKGGEA